MKDRAQCLLLDGLQILMVNQGHGGRDYWCLPGGGVEVGETPEQAAKRELLEECGLTAEQLELISTQQYGLDTHCSSRVTTFSGELMTGCDPELSEQIIRAVAWKHVDELTALDLAFVISNGLISSELFRRYLGWSGSS